MSVILEAHNLHWLSSLEPCQDLCAHGEVEFAVDDNELVKPADGIFTVSSTAIELLRAFHKGEEALPGRGHLFPTAGFNFYKLDHSPYIAIMDEPNGIDFDIRVGVDEVDIYEKKKDGNVFFVEIYEWKKAVLSFSKKVLDFYEFSGEKYYGGECESHQNHPLLMKEWKARHAELART